MKGISERVLATSIAAVLVGLLAVGCSDETALTAGSEADNEVASLKGDVASLDPSSFETTSIRYPILTSWQPPRRVLNINTKSGPEVEVFNNRLHIVYRGAGTNTIGYLTMNTSNVFTNRSVVGTNDKTYGQPSLAVNAGKLYLAYSGTDNVPTNCGSYTCYGRAIGLKYIGTSGGWSSTKVIKEGPFSEQPLVTDMAPELVQNSSRSNIDLYFRPPNGTYQIYRASSVSGGSSLNLQLLFIGSEVSVPFYDNETWRVGASLYRQGLSISGIRAAEGPSATIDSEGDIHMVYRGTANGLGYIAPNNTSYELAANTKTGASPATAIFNNRIYIFFKDDDSDELWYTYANL